MLTDRFQPACKFQRLHSSGWLIALCMLSFHGLSQWGMCVEAAATEESETQSTQGIAETSLEETSPIDAPYCGLCALHGAMTALDREVPFTDLLKQEYIGSRSGSSMEDLIRAARQEGLHAAALSRITCSMLRHAKSPVILHVKRDASYVKYNHWVLFLGMEGDRPVVYDFGERMPLEGLGELSAIWDRVGLFVSDRPINRASVSLPAVPEFLFYFGLIALVVAVTIRIINRLERTRPKSHWHSLGEAVAQATCLLAIALSVALGFWRFGGAGYLSESQAVRAIQDAHLADFIARIDAKEVEKLQGRPEVTFVDARFRKDFKKGHLSGAINIPPTSTEEQCREVMAAIPNEQRVVIYCQLDGCSFSGRIAKKLASVGYSNLVLFPGGWTEWILHAGKTDVTP